MKSLVIYHANCRDGQAAGYAARTGLAREIGEANIVTAPFTYDQNPAEAIQLGLDCDELYIVDFSFKRGPLIELAQHFRHIKVLDHHKTAQADLTNWDTCPTNVWVKFDMDRSGARLAFDYFNLGQERTDGVAAIPRTLFDYVQDRDLWQWKLDHSKEISAWIDTLGESLDDFGGAVDFAKKNGLDQCVVAGTAVLGYRNQVVAKHLKNFQPHAWLGHQVAIVNATTLISEVCNQLLIDHPEIDFAASYQDILGEGKRVVSLRARKGGVDVSSIAKKFGGGGHAAAAGFTVAVDYPVWVP